MSNKRTRMNLQQFSAQEQPQSLLQLPDECLASILRNLDATSLVSLEQTAKIFSRKENVSNLRLPLTEHIARALVLERCGGDETVASRFRHITWKERLYLEDNAGCGFDRSWCENAGFSLENADTDASSPGPLTMRLLGMGPKLMLSDKSTADQSVLHWRVRVRGNTAVEFGVIPVNLKPTHTALHKCIAVSDSPEERCVGFCSQITAGSLLPLKAPVMRGTVLDIVAKRGRLQVVLQYPPDAKEISWHNGQPVQRPYRGPSQLRFEQDFSDEHDVRLAVTSWAKATFEVLHHSGVNTDEWFGNDTSVDDDDDDEEEDIQSGGGGSVSRTESLGSLHASSSSGTLSSMLDGAVMTSGSGGNSQAASPTSSK